MKNMKNKIIVMICVALLPLILIASAWTEKAKADEVHNEQSTERWGHGDNSRENMHDMCMEKQRDIWSISEKNYQKNIHQEKEVQKVEVDFPKEEHLRTIGRLAQGILKYKKRKGGWYRCGHRATEKEMENWSVTWAYRIVEVSWNVSDGKGEEWNLSPWGIAGIAMHESGMDECAVGPNVRGLAYQLGILKRSRLTISHKKEDVLEMLKDKRILKAFKGSGVDIGGCQMLSKYYTRPTDYKSIMTLGYGMDECAREMRHRSHMYKSNTP